MTDTRVVAIWSLDFMNLLKQKSAVSLMANNQYLDPPKLFSWTELISRKSHSPGMSLQGFFSLFVFFCFNFARVQLM